jgi:hypothetical protein
LSSSPRFSKTNDLQKRRRIDIETVDRNDVDQALAVIVPALECSNEPPQLISTQLPYLEANRIENRPGKPTWAYFVHQSIRNSLF